MKIDGYFNYVIRFMGKYIVYIEKRGKTINYKQELIINKGERDIDFVVVCAQRREKQKLRKLLYLHFYVLIFNWEIQFFYFYKYNIYIQQVVSNFCLRHNLLLRYFVTCCKK